MASNYSHKTTVSLYKFDSEENYRNWLGMNSSQINSGFHDILAIVKNSKLNNGFDLFFNGHSLTKSIVYIKKNGKLVEVTSDSNCFEENKQYLIKNFSRNGTGQKNIITLEEIDIDKLVKDTADYYINSDGSFKEFVTNKINALARAYFQLDFDQYIISRIDAYFERHKKTHEEIETILTNAHNNFRKLFSLLHQRKRPNLGLNVTFIDREGKKRSDLGLYIKTASINKISFDINNFEGLDFEYESIKVQVSDFGKENWKTVWEKNGSSIKNGHNGPFDCPFFIDKDSKVKTTLTFKNKYLDDSIVDDDGKFGESLSYKTEQVNIENTMTFYIDQEPDSNSSRITYAVYIPMSSDGAEGFILEPRYRNIKNLESVEWMLNNAVAQKEKGEKSYILIFDTSTNEFVNAHFNDNSCVLTNNSIHGEYISPDENIFSTLFSVDNNTNQQTLRIPGQESKAYQLYLLVPLNYSNIQINSKTVEPIETNSSKSYSLFKSSSPLLGKTQIPIKISY